MFLIDAALILVMLFFLFLPITDRRTVQMRLVVLCTLAAVFAASVTWTHVPHLQLAGIEFDALMRHDTGSDGRPAQASSRGIWLWQIAAMR